MTETNAVRDDHVFADAAKKIKELYQFMCHEGLYELDWSNETSRIKISRSHQMHLPATQNLSVPITASGNEETVKVEPKDSIKSPITGTFYVTSLPGAASYAKPGDRVGADQTVCIIEAMKVMNEIKAGKPCVIIRCMVNDGERVIEGQPLFEIEE